MLMVGGKGFAMAISKRWKQPEIEYRNWYKNKEVAQTDTVIFERLECETNTTQLLN
jgi:hypothetical protein